MNTHHWIAGGTRRTREARRTELGLPSGPVVDAHRNLRGTASAAGALLRELAAGVPHGFAVLTIESAHAADRSDLDLIGGLLARTHPARLTVVVGSAGPPPFPDSLTLHRAADDLQENRLSARKYVWSDGTPDHPGARTVYDLLGETARRLLHDRRADELEARGDLPTRFGPIPFHRSQGSNPRQAPPPGARG